MGFEEYQKLREAMISSLRLHTGYKTADDLNGADVKNFLSWLSVERKVSSSTQIQALNALVYFFKNVLRKKADDLYESVGAKRTRRLPVVLTKEELSVIFSYLEEPYKPVGSRILILTETALLSYPEKVIKTGLRCFLLMLSKN